MVEFGWQLENDIMSAWSCCGGTKKTQIQCVVVCHVGTVCHGIQPCSGVVGCQWWVGWEVEVWFGGVAGGLVGVRRGEKRATRQKFAASAANFRRVALVYDCYFSPGLRHGVHRTWVPYGTLVFFFFLLYLCVNMGVHHTSLVLHK